MSHAIQTASNLTQCHFLRRHDCLYGGDCANESRFSQEVEGRNFGNSLGAATVMGSLMYGAGHCWHGTINMHLRGSLLDNQFLSSLDLTDVPGSALAQPRYPPVALIECVADIAQVRPLHLVIVDLWRPWKINQTQVRSLTGAQTTPILCRLYYTAVTRARKDSALWKKICVWV